MLAFSAGAVNVIAFLACSRFVTHVTGTVSQIGMTRGSFVLALEYGVVLGSFVLGAMTSAVAIDGRHHRKKPPIHALPLIGVAAVLVLVAGAGAIGVFGEFGGAVESRQDFALLSVLAFASGVQNAAVATSTGALVRTTHMTGPATDLGVHLSSAVFATGDARRTSLRHAALRAGKIAAFATGGATGAILAATLEFRAFLLPAMVVLIATALSFLPDTSTRNSQELAS
jgi:uncharacterized membrane protein YoaK (UPF0700 family)